MLKNNFFKLSCYLNDNPLFTSYKTKKQLKERCFMAFVTITVLGYKLSVEYVNGIVHIFS